MKILLVNKFLYPNGGSETYIFKLGEYLNSLGHEVQFFGMKDERNIVGNNWNMYTSNINFRTGKLQKLLYPFKIIYSYEARKKIRKIIDEFKPDVVHLNNINFQITPAIIDEVKRDNIRVVWTAHDYQVICPNHLMYSVKNKHVCDACLDGKFINCTRNRCIHNSTVKSILGTIEAYLYKIRKTYNKVDLFICPSVFLENKLIHYPGLKGKTVSLHNFIDLVEWQEVEKKKYVLYFGRYSEEKGFTTLLEAVKQLSNIKFVFAGRGPLEASLKGIPNITNVGFISGEELVTLISEAMFSLCTSSCYENCPFSVMESQMYGTPVIGSNLGGIPELIQNNKTGLIFEDGNVEDLITCIKRLTYDSVMRNELHDNCKNLEFDTISEYCKKLISIYKGDQF